MTAYSTRTVEIVLDTSCIWSYLGYTRFQRAASRYRELGGDVEVAFQPFQVHPDASVEGEPLLDVLRRHFGPDFEDDETFGAEDGLTIKLADAIHVNTFESHRLVALAAEQGLGEQMVERLFRAYYTDGLNVADLSVLARLAAEVGVKLTDDGRAELRAELDRVRRSGIRGVPVFRFEDGRELSGAQTEAVYFDALTRKPS